MRLLEETATDVIPQRMKHGLAGSQPARCRCPTPRAFGDRPQSRLLRHSAARPALTRRPCVEAWAA